MQTIFHLLKSFKSVLLYLWMLCLGTLCSLSFPPYDIVFLLFISYGFLYIFLWNTHSLKEAALGGFFFGAGHFFIGFHWLFYIATLYSGMQFFGIFLVMFGILFILSLTFAFTSILARYTLKYNSLWLIITIPSLLSLNEWLRGILFTGLPWFNISDALLFPLLNPLLQIFGPIGISFIFYMSLGAIVFSILSKEKKFLFSSALILVVLGLILNMYKPSFTQKSKEKMYVQVIHGDFSRDEKFSDINTIKRVEFYSKLALSGPNSGISLWPESVISVPYKNVKESLQNTRLSLYEGGMNVFMGAYVQRNSKSHNVIMHFPSEEIVYSKMHLIPFGEYKPKWFEYFESILPDVPMDRLSSRIDEKKCKAFSDVNVSMGICFETLFSNDIRTENFQSQLLMHISDLGWLEGMWAKSYFLRTARARASEHAKPMLYSTNQGISAIIDADGKILVKVSEKGTQLLYGNVSLYKGSTPYVKFGNSLILSIIFVLLICSFLYQNKARLLKLLFKY